MSHRPCARCGIVFREPDGNSAPVVCYGCGAVYPSFDEEDARDRIARLQAEISAPRIMVASDEAPPDGPSIVSSPFNLPRGPRGAS